VSQSRISTLEMNSGVLTLNQLLALFGAYGLQLLVDEKGWPAGTPVASGVEW
jgi:HTH-type transcriptional regulator/antitoxin HipB